ncbi:MAG: DUF6249 domain-containing protein [Acidobacteria bacterium]|nr:DUF6249 domain-containing protein [Acidobacteriota bacterium]
MMIPIVAIVMSMAIPIVAILVGYGIFRQKTQVKLKAIEKGVSIPFESEDPYERMAKSRKNAIIATMVGLGIVVFFTVVAFAVDDPEVFSGAAIGAIPFFIGIGLFIDAHLRRKDMEKHKASSPQAPSGQPSSGQSGEL